MSGKSTAIVLIVVGVLVALLFALADVIGVGRDPGTFGIRQIVGTIIGVVIFVVGIVFLLRGQTA